MSTMRMNPETGYPEIMPDSRIPPGGHTLGRIGGLPGLQPPPLDPRQQIQQIMAQGPTQPQRQSGREGYINSKLSVAFFNSPEAEQQAREQFGKDYDADPSIYQQQPMIDSTGSQRGGMAQFDQLQRPPGTMGLQQRLKNSRLPKAEGLGVSSFVGASSNDMQRMLNRGSISGDNMGDAQRRMEQLRSNEFLAKMRAQNPERFNNPSPPLPLAGMPQQMPPPLAGGAPQYPGNVPPGLAEPRQFPFNPFLNKTTPSTAQPSDQGVMGQAPPNLTQYLEMMRSPMQQGGYGGPPAQAPQVNPMQSYGMMGMANPMQAQMSQMPEQIMQQGGYAPMQAPTGSQNSAPIASPFA